MDIREKTAAGGAVSLVSAVLMGILFLAETNSYIQGTTNNYNDTQTDRLTLSTCNLRRTRNICRQHLNTNKVKKWQ